MLYGGQLKLKVDGNVALQREGLATRAAHGSGREPNVTGKLGSAHDWVGMDGDQEIMVVL